MGPTSWNVVKLFLAAGTPLQKFFLTRGDTHVFCMNQSLKILKNDGVPSYANILNNYIEILKRGLLWADKGWKNFSHYYDPISNNGFGPCPNACQEFNNFFQKAKIYFNTGDIYNYYFFLGAAIHLIQDLCVPHHAIGAAFSGHQEYENWVLCNYGNYGVDNGGIYKKTATPSDWLVFNARLSRRYFPYVSIISTETSYKFVTSVMLPLAQRTTAGFLKFAIDNNNDNGNNNE